MVAIKTDVLDQTVKFDFYAYYYYDYMHKSQIIDLLSKTEVNFMSSTEKILELAKKNNGTITSSQITKAGISREYLRKLVKSELLERVERGVYILPDCFDDELYSLQMRYKKGVFSHETALFLLDLSDRTPIKFSMTFPLNYNTTAIKAENLICHRVKTDNHQIGVISVQSPGGNPIRIYNPERTLCDILKGRSNTDIQVITDAFKRYAGWERKDIPLLSEYSKLFRIEKKIRAYLEVLL